MDAKSQPTVARDVPVDELRRAQHSLSRWLRRHGTPRDDVEDAIQDAFVRLYRTEREMPVHNPTGFLMAAVKRIRIDHWRCAKRRERLFVTGSPEALETPDPAPRPDDAAETDERLAALARRLETLSPRTRDIFVLSRLEGRTYAEIASALGISVSAVEKHIARAALSLANGRPDKQY